VSTAGFDEAINRILAMKEELEAAGLPSVEQLRACGEARAAHLRGEPTFQDWGPQGPPPKHGPEIIGSIALMPLAQKLIAAAEVAVEAARRGDIKQQRMAESILSQWRDAYRFAQERMSEALGLKAMRPASQNEQSDGRQS
jgi:hypothetical protein